MASNFARPEVHLTEIQALSNHKKEYGGWLKEFFQELVCFVGKMAARTHFWVILSNYMTHRAKTLRAIHWIVPELMSGELQIQQHLKPKIKPATL